MTIQEMHVAVDLGLQRIASHVYDDFLPQEIDLYLNNAIDKFVSANRDAIVHSGDELIARKANENIFTLINTGTISPTDLNAEFEGSYSVPISFLNPEFQYFLNSRTRVGTEWRNNRLVSVQDLTMYTTTVTDSPIFRELPIAVLNNRLLGITSTNDDLPNQVYLTYTSPPVRVQLDINTPANSVNCDLPSFTHQTIVDAAVSLMNQDLLKLVPQREE